MDYEAIARALYLSVKDVVDNWKPNSGTSGLPLRFLTREAKELAKKKDWVAFNAVLAVMIYGIVLFPNIQNFVDLPAICVLMSGNPVPTLLADTYYAIHSRHMKGGVIKCCLPLLYKWFLSHLPNIGPFVTTQGVLKWPKRVMSLTSHDIRWHDLRVDTSEIILSCGDFPNVPLIGTKCCINYNPLLALRQLG